MENTSRPEEILANWHGVLGNTGTIVHHDPDRDLWKIRYPSGAGFYLKKYGPWRNLPLRHEAQVLGYLARQGIGVATFVPTDSGLIHAGTIDEQFVLMPALENHELSAAELLECESRIGAAMASLHRALARYPDEIDAYTEDLAATVAGDLLLPSSLMNAFTPRQDEIAAAVATLPVQLVHGDMTPANILVTATGEVSGFIDFDHLPMAPRIWDVSKYLSRRMRTLWRRDDLSATYARAGHIAPFLRGYQSVSPLPQEELAALPGLIAAANVIETSYFTQISAGVLPRRILPDHDEVLADSTETAQWHLEHWNEIEQAVASVT